MVKTRDFSNECTSKNLEETSLKIHQNLMRYVRALQQTSKEPEEKFIQRLGISRHQYFTILSEKEPSSFAKALSSLEGLALANQISIEELVSCAFGKSAEDGSTPRTASDPARPVSNQKPRYIVVNDDGRRRVEWERVLGIGDVATYERPEELVEDVEDPRTDFSRVEFLVLDRFYFGNDKHGSKEFDHIIRFCKKQKIPLVLASTSYVRRAKKRWRWWQDQSYLYDLITDSKPRSARNLLLEIKAKL